MLHNNFINKIEQESVEFKAIMSLLTQLNDSAEKGRKLLCLVNHITDFYTLRDIKSEDEVKMPIVYFPLCEDWAQFLCEEFVSLKMSLFWNEDTKTRLLTSYRCNQHFCLPEGVSKKEAKALKNQFVFKRNVSNVMTKEIIGFPSKRNEKCFLYSRNIFDKYQLTIKTKVHYHFSSDLMSQNFFSEKSLILLGESEEDVYKAIECNDGKVKVPNIFLFLQKDLDGRNNKLCMQMQRTTMNEYNEDYDTGIKNVLSFVFSQKPYRLQRVFENKRELVERLQREKISETRDFISFTKEEMDYIFDRQKPSINFFKLDYEERSEEHQIKEAFDLMLQDMPHEVKLRNELAICFTEQSRLKIKEQILKQNPEANEEYIEYFLRLLQKQYTEVLYPELLEWINFQPIAVVLDYNVDPYYQNQLNEFLVNECGATIVNFYTFKNFKAHKDDSIFVNSITENKIIVMSMLNHCTGSNWAIYPNSFDQYHLNEGQSVLQINNKIVFDPRFSWYQYRYAEQIKLLLNSDFRIKYVKSGIILPTKPINVGAEPKDDEDEQNTRNRQSGRDQKRISISFGRRQHRTFDEEELVLCKRMGELSICTVLAILNNFDDTTTTEIQPLIDFHQPLETFIDNEERKSDGESIMRNNPKYGLTDEEKSSKREMWKIMLEHKVKEFGEKIVYNQIMSALLPIERIQLSSFKRWLDHSESSILPRSRRMQKRVIEEYLQIENLYTRMLRHRKSRSSTNTEGMNSIFKTFLTRTLLENDTKKAYESLSNEVRDYLNIASGSDIKIIVDLIKDETLNLRTIKSIKHD